MQASKFDHSHEDASLESKVNIGSADLYTFRIPIENLSIITGDFPDYIQNCSCKSQKFCHLHPKTPKKKSIHICPGSNLKFIWKMLFDEVDLGTHLIFLAQHHICFIQDQGFYIPTIDDLLLRQILEEAWCFFYVENEPVEALG